MFTIYFSQLEIIGNIKLSSLNPKLSLQYIFTLFLFYIIWLVDIKLHSVQVSCDRDPVVFISGPRSPPRGFLQAALPDSLVTISRSGVVGVHSWLPYDRHNNRGFILDTDPTTANAKSVSYLICCILFYLPSSLSLFPYDF